LLVCKNKIIDIKILFQSNLALIFTRQSTRHRTNKYKYITL